MSICSRGRADVSALDVAEHVQALLLGVFAGHGVGVDACRTERLIHGDLRFDRRHDVCDGVDDGAVEFEEGHGKLHGRRFRRIFNLFADFLSKAGHDLRWHERFGRVKSHNARILLGCDCFDQAIHQSSLLIRLKTSFEPMMVASGRPVTCHPPNGVLRAEEWNRSGFTVHASSVLSTTRSARSSAGTLTRSSTRLVSSSPGRRLRIRQATL